MIITKRARSVLRWIRKIYKHKYKVDLSVNIQIPWKTKMRYNLIGFTDQDYFSFNLKENDYHQYISYQERLRLEDINGEYASILGNKLVFERLFGKYVNVPRIFCWEKGGNFLDLELGKKVDITQIIREQKKVIVKPVRSVGGGIGISLLEFENGQYYMNHEMISEADLLTILSKCDNYIFIQYISSAEYSRNVYSGSTNTIRVVTCVSNDNDIDVLLAFHRFGSDTSAPVDNISSGGLFSLIDLETGVLSEARQIVNPSNHFTMHPDTNVLIKGLQIPGWHDLLDYIINAHKCFAYYNFMAWDIAIDEFNQYWVLEINRGCDLSIQMIKPQRYEKLGKYMRSKGLLDKW
ncbi:MAG: sugar-transfer associated ATP-grasp domain-containing protein [Erysipelotrichaceae bacterium]|nr:sugar-transfer associated ATP-grasp domain-containing protein [Erysipelotrichaceae bacterium]